MAPAINAPDRTQALNRPLRHLRDDGRLPRLNYFRYLAIASSRLPPRRVPDHAPCARLPS